MFNAEMKVVLFNNDVVTTSGGFDYANCNCYNSSAPGDPCDDEGF